ncbi:hypothetical protein SAMN05421503_1422 [Terribacillus aidingensis]|uniref:Uncharacterized protein n=1 Tax=Terribacillus aidingensis TaxID=586416 RepID=A0A285NLU6_9BACI|nr:hypothetical protein [Terribacillus aidingensis]SNZ09927.1 hypothetical protein SAMN05421503_1422 [Terribacillus aidingensis]
MVVFIIAILWWVIIFGIWLAIVAAMRKHSKRKSEEQDAVLNHMAEYDKEFHGDLFFPGLDGQTKIAYNKDVNLFKYYQRTSSSTIQEYSFSADKVLDASFELNGETVSKVSRTQQIGGALIGGVIAGGVGAIIGGLSSDRRHDELIKKATLKINTADVEKPVLYVEFLPSLIPGSPQEKGFPKNGEVVQAVLKKLEQWEGIFKIAMNKNTTAS